MAQKEAKTSEEVKPPAEPAMVIASTAAPAPSWFTPKRYFFICSSLFFGSWVCLVAEKIWEIKIKV